MEAMKHTTLCTLTALLLVALASPLHARTFTYFNGRTVEAEFVRLAGNQVTLNIAGRPTVVMLGLFSAADQKFIRESAAGANPSAPAAATTPAPFTQTGNGAGALKNLVYNGGFEEKSEQNPPPGWLMWGSKEGKNPDNFARDTKNPHSGKACLRITHPADTGTFITSDPQHAIRPQKGMVYTMKFWARTDKPGPSMFVAFAYSSLTPMVAAKINGIFLVTDVGTEWKEYAYTLTEGKDFILDRPFYLTLSFKATSDTKLQKTLWIDDVTVTAQPGVQDKLMVDESKVPVPALEHRLRPGGSLSFTVDASVPGWRATLATGGISYHRLGGFSTQPYNRKGEYTLPHELEVAIRELRLPMTRIYSVGDEPFGMEGGIDRAAELLKRTGIPEETTVLELETQGASTMIAPDDWARAVRYSIQKGHKFRYWEVSNEPYYKGAGACAFPTSDDYIKHVKEVSVAIRKVQPTALIGMSFREDRTAWGNYLLAHAAGYYDFTAAHWYGLMGSKTREHTFESAVLTDNYKILNDALKLNAMMRVYNPGRDVFQYDTEWGASGAGPEGVDKENRNGNILGTLYRAVRLIYYAREGMLRGASSWSMFFPLKSPGMAILSQHAPNQRFMMYWLYYYFNRHVGAQVLPMDGTAPYYTPAKGDDSSKTQYPGPLTPVLATLSADKSQLYLVIANGSWSQAFPCSVTTKGYNAKSANGVLLSNNDLDANPLLQRKEDAISDFPVTVGGAKVTCNVPPHSVVFITLEKSGKIIP